MPIQPRHTRKGPPLRDASPSGHAATSPPANPLRIDLLILKILLGSFVNIPVFNRPKPHKSA